MRSTQSRRTDDILDYNIASSSPLASKYSTLILDYNIAPSFWTNDDASKHPFNCASSNKGFAFIEERPQDVLLLNQNSILSIILQQHRKRKQYKKK